MRLRPGGGFLSRVCTQDYKMPGSNLVIDKGSIVHIPVLGLHKDPQYFPDPEKFNPDRFKNMDEVPKGVFFPFGGGPRMCIGKFYLFNIFIYLWNNLLHWFNSPA